MGWRVDTSNLSGIRVKVGSKVEDDRQWWDSLKGLTVDLSFCFLFFHWKMKPASKRWKTSLTKRWPGTTVYPYPFLRCGFFHRARRRRASCVSLWSSWICSWSGSRRRWIHASKRWFPWNKSLVTLAIYRWGLGEIFRDGMGWRMELDGIWWAFKRELKFLLFFFLNFFFGLPPWFLVEIPKVGDLSQNRTTHRPLDFQQVSDLEVLRWKEPIFRSMLCVLVANICGHGSFEKSGLAGCFCEWHEVDVSYQEKHQVKTGKTGYIFQLGFPKGRFSHQFFKVFPCETIFQSSRLDNLAEASQNRFIRKNSQEIVDFQLQSMKSGGILAQNARFHEAVRFWLRFIE